MTTLGRQAGRQVYVCTDDPQRLLSEASLREVLVRCIVSSADFVALLRAGRVGCAAVDGRAVTPSLEGQLRRARDSGIAVPFVCMTPGDVPLSHPHATWADGSVRSHLAHRDLVPALRASLVRRTLVASAAGLRRRVSPVQPADAPGSAPAPTGATAADNRSRPIRASRTSSKQGSRSPRDSRCPLRVQSIAVILRPQRYNTVARKRRNPDSTVRSEAPIRLPACRETNESFVARAGS